MFLLNRLISGFVLIVFTSVILVLFSTVLLTGDKSLQVNGTPIVSFADAADALSNVGDQANKMYEKVSEKVGETLDKAKDSGSNEADGMFDRVKDLTKSVFESITNGGKRMIDSVKDTWDKHM